MRIQVYHVHIPALFTVGYGEGYDPEERPVTLSPATIAERCRHQARIAARHKRVPLIVEAEDKQSKTSSPCTRRRGSASWKRWAV